MERLYRTEALVLRHRPLGEADRLVTLLTWERGKLCAVARGARKTKSKLAAGVDFFTHGYFILYRGKTFPTITGQEVKERFLHFRQDPDLYPYGLYLAELADLLLEEEQPAPECCRLLAAAWRLLGEGVDRALLSRAFELKLMSAIGYRPHLEGCLSCGDPEATLFSPRQGGLLCPSCSGGEGMGLEKGTLSLARHLLNTPLEQIKAVRSTRLQKAELDQAFTAFLSCQLDINRLKSRPILKFMEEKREG